MRKFGVFAYSLAFAILCLTASVAPRQNVERRVVKAFAPPYDELLVMARLEGTARFEIRVAPSGEVEDVQVTKLFFGPNRSELYAQYAREWRFEPAETTTTEEIVFEFRFVPRDSPPTEEGTVFVSPTTVEIRHRQPRHFLFKHPIGEGDHPSRKRLDQPR